jgi:signal transduction histidine kinase
VERVTPLWPLRRVFESRALEIDLPAGLPAASGDAAGLGHALLQLLRNAAEAAAAVSAGRVAVAVTHDEAMLWLSVADNGPGLAAPLERLREFGYSGWQGRRHLGVGLVLVHGLAQAMGARFELADGGPLGGAQARIGLPCWSG